jgi:hypothetical protein
MQDVCRFVVGNQPPREGIRKYLSDKKWKSLLEYGRRKALETGVGPEDIENIIDKVRISKTV